MSKRNFILLIIILIIAGAIIFGFFYFRQNTTIPGTVSTGTNFISQFNPFGNNEPATTPIVTPPTDVSSGQTNPATDDLNAKLKKVSSVPVAGFTLLIKNNVPALRYVDKATGNIYETFVDKIEETKLSTTIIPKIYEAFFGNKGNSVVMRYLKEDGRTIATFVGALPKKPLTTNTNPDTEVKGSFLPENIKDVSLSPDAGSIFYLFNVGDNMIGTTLNLTNNKKAQIFSSPFTEWLSGWPNSKMITFTTKPASGIPGYMYAIDLSTKNFNKIISKINGLTTLESPNGKLTLYSDDNLTLNIYHADTKVSDLLGIKTLPEKCVWGKLSDFVYCAVPKTIEAGQYPDVWYQGIVSFSDQIWKIDIKSGNATLVLDPIAISGAEVDGIKLLIDNNENYLFFVNKKDSFLWEFALK